jgi:hypothetical protein
MDDPNESNLSTEMLKGFFIPIPEAILNIAVFVFFENISSSVHELFFSYKIL